MARVNINIFGISELKWNGMEWVNLTQMTLVVKNPPANARDVRDMVLIPGAGMIP